MKVTIKALVLGNTAVSRWIGSVSGGFVGGKVWKGVTVLEQFVLLD